MSDKIKWYKDAEGSAEGFYSRVGIGRDGRPVERFTVRFWHPERKRMFYVAAGTTLKQARKMKVLADADPDKIVKRREAALAAKRAPKPLTFAALADRFLAEYPGSMKGRRTGLKTDFYRHVAESWKGYFKGAASDVNRADVEAYRERLRNATRTEKVKGEDGKTTTITVNKYGDSTIRKYVGAVGTLYRWAMRAGLATANPAADVDRPQDPDRLVEVLTREQEPLFLEHVDDDHRIACELYLAAGFRMTEGLDLRWGQVNRSSGEILVHKSKTNKARAVPINGRLAGILDRASARLRSDILRKDIEAGRAPEARVLCYPDARPLDRFKLARAIDGALDVAEIDKRPGCCANLLRHTFGSRLAERGIPMPVIATLMGNSPDIAFKHYVRFSPGHLKAAMATLDPGVPEAPGVANGVASKDRRRKTGSSESSQTIA